MTRMDRYRPTFVEWLQFGWWVFVLVVCIVVVVSGVIGLLR